MTPNDHPYRLNKEMEQQIEELLSFIRNWNYKFYHDFIEDILNNSQSDIYKSKLAWLQRIRLYELSKYLRNVYGVISRFQLNFPDLSIG